MPHDTARVMNARTPDTKNYEIMKKKNGINQPAVLHNSNNHIDNKKKWKSWIEAWQWRVYYG